MKMPSVLTEVFVQELLWLQPMLEQASAGTDVASDGSD